MPRHFNRLAAPLLICALLALGLSSSMAEANTAADLATGRPIQTLLLPADAIVPGQAAALLTEVGDGYLSPITEAAPFTHMLLRWEASEPVTDTITLEARASLDGTSWTPWGLVPENPDLWVPADGDQVFWSQELYAGKGAHYWQVRAHFTPAPDGRMPELRKIEVNTVDARFGPATPLPDAALMAVERAGIGKPAVVSRSAWGSPDGQGSRVNPVHYPINHMVVHHTADANSLTGSEQSWADRVRAIWSFHTYTRGWGDIGYNYLVDPNGVRYEGRAGGDDAVAFHDTANYGSMGVVLIGTFASVDPRASAVDSLVELLAWKADQKRIDPLGRSFYYGCSISNYCKPYNSGGLVENIAGHRQVTPGHTSCPGDRLIAFLPSVRQRVQARLQGEADSGTPDDGDLLIDELETSFERSAATWYEVGCGYGGHTYYTYATDSAAESSNRAVWTPNLPAAGHYRVLAHIPQGCGLGTSTSAAHYRIHAAQTHDIRVDQNSSEEWVSLGVFAFAAGRAGYVELDDLTGEPYSARRTIFFDSLKWVREEPDAKSLELLDVQYDRDTVAAGELLKVTFTVRNSGNTTIEGQDPQAGTRTDLAASFDLGNSYVYDEGECFGGATGQDYPAYPKEAGRFRVLLGPASVARAPLCDGNHGGYPWRWGLNGKLGPGETRAVIGYVRFREPGIVALQAGAVQEYVDYVARDVFAKTITVTAERLAPAPTSYDALLRPLAHVYRLGDVPDNLLARTTNPLSVVKGAELGSFAWQGETLDWSAGGPVDGIEDGFVIEQTRVFVAPVRGEYSFRVTSDDGSWLWVNGVEVAANAGLHETSSVSGTLALEAGRHVLSFKYFERSGAATAGYSVRMPGSDSFGPLTDGLGGREISVDRRLGARFSSLGGLTLAADDQGGSGVAALRVSFDGVEWLEVPGGVFTLGSLVDGSYSIQYTAVDAVGNESSAQELRFTVDSTVRIQELFLPMITSSSSAQ